jgi:hypothetical protein
MIVFTDTDSVDYMVVVRYNVHGLTRGWPMIVDRTKHTFKLLYQLMLFGP